MITTYDVLLVNTVEGSCMQKKRQHSLSNTYLSTPFGVKSDPPVFHAACKFWTKSVENYVLS